MDKLVGALGLCARARALVFGVPMVTEAVCSGKGKIKIVCLASDAADNAQKKVSDKCKTYGVPVHVLPLDGETLAKVTGKSAKLSAVGVTDANLSQLVIQQLN